MSVKEGQKWYDASWDCSGVYLVSYSVWSQIDFLCTEVACFHPCAYIDKRVMNYSI